MVTNHSRTMKHFGYGLDTPSALLEKLQWEGSKLTSSPHPFDVFNFILTAAILAEWIEKFYKTAGITEAFAAPIKSRKSWLIPSMSPSWIKDISCLPNPGCDFNRHITNALSI